MPSPLSSTKRLLRRLLDEGQAEKEVELERKLSDISDLCFQFSDDFDMTSALLVQKILGVVNRREQNIGK